MADRSQQYVEKLPDELDRFLSEFFPGKKWLSRVQYDHLGRRFFLDVVVRDDHLLGDDRFLSLLAFYARGQRLLLHDEAGLELQCRLYTPEGADLTTRLRDVEATYLDDRARSSLIGRQIAWLGFRRRLLRSFVPRMLLWAAVIALLTIVLGLSFQTAVLLCLTALVVQALLTAVTSAPRL